MEDLDKSFPAAEGMVDAEQGGSQKRYNESCLNCGTKLEAVFCHRCGQKDLPRRQKLGELWSNFLSSFWSYEGKFFLTTKYLITRPGFLALEYTSGKRESYYHPARMYVFISFIFFLLFISLPDDDVIELSDEDKKELQKANIITEGALEGIRLDTIGKSYYVMDSSMRNRLAALAADTVKGEKKKKGLNFSLSGAKYESMKHYDSVQAALPERDRDGWVVELFTRRSIKLNEKFADDEKEFEEVFGNAFLENFSKVLFFLLPIFALLLKLLYVRKDYFFSEHLVFSIYYYNFFYLAGSLMMLIGTIPALGWLSTLVGFSIYFYLLLAMKRMYQQRWGKTIFKFLIFGFLFMIFLILGLAVNALAIIMMI